MQTEIFSGTYSQLKARLDAIILAGPSVINDVIKLNGGVYLILYT